jgi:hypothetical protein
MLATLATDAAIPPPTPAAMSATARYIVIDSIQHRLLAGLSPNGADCDIDRSGAVHNQGQNLFSSNGPWLSPDAPASLRRWRTSIVVE